MSHTLALQYLDADELAALERPKRPSERHPQSVAFRSRVFGPLISSVLIAQFAAFLMHAFGAGFIGAWFSGLWIGLALAGALAMGVSLLLDSVHRKSLPGSLEYQHYLAAKTLTSTRTLAQYQVVVHGDDADTIVSLILVDRTQSPTRRSTLESQCFYGGDMDTLETVVIYHAELEERARQLNGQARKSYIDHQAQLQAASEMRELVAGSPAL